MPEIKSLIPHANGNVEFNSAEKQQIIEEAAKAYASYLDALRFDWRSDPNSKDTPMRVAKAFINE